MPLLPRWRYMTSSSRRTLRNLGVGLAVVLLGLVVLRGLISSLLPLLLLVLLLVLLWKTLRR